MQLFKLLNLQPGLLKIFLNSVLIFTVLVVIYFFLITDQLYTSNNNNININNSSSNKNEDNYNIWLIFTKVTERSPLKYKFHNLLKNLLNTSSVPLNFHIIVDNRSHSLVRKEIKEITNIILNKSINYQLYNVENCAKQIEDIVGVMKPFFSSRPGSYYSDSLFYLSLGLYRIAPKDQERAVLLDCDLYFKQDVALLFQEFDKFKPTALFGLAPELSPVYRHVLHMYKKKYNSTFGDYYHHYDKMISNDGNITHPNGFQGYNSGVVLLKLSAISKSSEFRELLKNDTVIRLTTKYKFRGHLGDQDFYTLIGFEYPHLIQTLNCGLNRQLCTWWKDHGYGDVFDNYYKCDHPIVVLHGNCNTKIPH